jgi:hypothetical protein
MWQRMRSLYKALLSLLILFPILSQGKEIEGLGECLSQSSYLKQPTNKQILQYVVYRETRGQSDKAMRAVIDVVNNRLHECNLLKHCTLKDVVTKAGAFPYVKHGIFLVRDKKFLQKYEGVVRMKPVVSKRVLYFNTEKHTFGVECKKIDKLVFCKGEYDGH